MDTLDEKLIATVVHHMIEGLPRTKSGKGYFLADSLRDFAGHIADTLVREHLLPEHTAHKVLARAAIKNRLFEGTIPIGFSWGRNRYFHSDLSKNATAMSVTRDIKYIKELPNDFLCWFGNLAKLFRDRAV